MESNPFDLCGKGLIIKRGRGLAGGPTSLEAKNYTMCDVSLLLNFADRFQVHYDYYQHF